MIERAAMAGLLMGIVCAGSAAVAQSVLGQSGPGQPAPWKPPGASPVPGLPRPSSPGDASAAELVKVHIAPDVARVRGGETFHLAVAFKIDPHWHIYWKNSGSSGAPTEIEVAAPPGFMVGDVRFPRPQAIRGEEGVSFGYENEVTLFVPVTAPPEPTSGQVMFSATVNYLVCKDICLMGQASQRVVVATGAAGVPAGVPDGPGSEASEGEQAANIERFKAQLPGSLEASGGTATYEDATLSITVPARGATTAEFFPIEVPGVTYGVATVKQRGDTLVVTVPVEVNPNNARGEPMKVWGVVGLGTSRDEPCYEFSIPVSAS